MKITAKWRKMSKIYLLFIDDIQKLHCDFSKEAKYDMFLFESRWSCFWIFKILFNEVII